MKLDMKKLARFICDERNHLNNYDDLLDALNRLSDLGQQIAALLAHEWRIISVVQLEKHGNGWTYQLSYRGNNFAIYEKSFAELDVGRADFNGLLDEHEFDSIQFALFPILICRVRDLQKQRVDELEAQKLKRSMMAAIDSWDVPKDLQDPKDPGFGYTSTGRFAAAGGFAK